MRAGIADGKSHDRLVEAGLKVKSAMPNVSPKVIAFIALALCALPVSTRAQEMSEDAARILSAVVGVLSEVPESARTARMLGRQRSGSGIIIDSNGLVVTIGYLVLEASKTEIVIDGTRRVPARVIAYDTKSGLGLLRATEPLNATPIILGESASVSVNDPVLIASYVDRPLLTPAVVVSRKEFAGYWEYLLETPILTTPPHSRFGGAALLGPDGRLLGVGSLVIGDVPFGANEVPGNLFVPIDKLTQNLGDLMTLGRPSESPQPWLGVYLQEFQDKVLVTNVAEDGPAEGAGLTRGDIIAGIGGEPVHSLAALYRQVWSTGSAGVSVTLMVVRNSVPREIVVHSADRYDWYLSQE